MIWNILELLEPDRGSNSWQLTRSQTGKFSLCVDHVPAIESSTKHRSCSGLSQRQEAVTSVVHKRKKSPAHRRRDRKGKRRWFKKRQSRGSGLDAPPVNLTSANQCTTDQIVQCSTDRPVLDSPIQMVSESADNVLSDKTNRTLTKWYWRTQPTSWYWTQPTNCYWTHLNSQC